MVDDDSGADEPSICAHVVHSVRADKVISNAEFIITPLIIVYVMSLNEGGWIQFDREVPF